MSLKSYEKQHLACYAAGHINGAGTTAVGFGCSLTRIGTGHYGIVLDANSGLVNDESYVFVTPKSTTAATRCVNDTSNTLKEIYVFDGSGSVLADTDIEIGIFRTVTR